MVHDSVRSPRSPKVDFATLLDDVQSERLTRRAVLRRGAMLGLSIPAIGGLLAACGGDDDDANDATSTSGTGETDVSPTTSGSTGTEASGGAAVDGGTLTIIQTGSIPDLDPHSAYDSDASAIFFGAYEMLVRFKGSETLEFEPMLADSWEASEDQTEWSFTIPEGVTFHDGTPCDAAAVVASFQRFHKLNLGPVGVLTRFVEKPEDITAPDSTTVTFKLVYGTDVFLGAMASQYGPLVVSPAAIEANKTGEDEFAHEWLRENMVGTGPFKLKESVLGDHITLERFEEFHGGWDGSHFDTIVFRNVEESQTRRQLVESGDADALTQSLTPDDVTSMQEEATTNVLVYDSTNVDWVYLNPVRLPDAKVRQAFCWAFPYEDVREGVYEQLIEATSGPVTPTTLGYPTDGFIYTQDLDQAKQLLDDAGFDYGQTMEFWITSGDQAEQAIAQLFQASAQELGVTVEIVSKEEGALTDFFYGEASGEERPHFYTWGWWPDYNDAWNEIYPNFHSQSAQTAAGGNAGVYSNADVDRLLDESSTMTSGPEYDQTIAEINRILVEEDPAGIFIGSVKWYTVLNPAIKGFVSNPIYINTYNVYDMYREA